MSLSKKHPVIHIFRGLHLMHVYNIPLSEEQRIRISISEVTNHKG